MADYFKIVWAFGGVFAGIALVLTYVEESELREKMREKYTPAQLIAMFLLAVGLWPCWLIPNAIRLFLTKRPRGS